MRISLHTDTFARRAGNEVLFYNPTNGACLAIDNCAVLYDVISRQDRSLDDIMALIAENSGISIATAKEDFLPLIGDMIQNGLLVSRDNGQNNAESVCGTANNNALCDFGDGDALGGFYQRHDLLMSLHMDVTSNCNERCVHCYIPNHEPDFLAFDSINEVLTDFRAMQGMTVYVSGGECMTHPDFARILRKCRSLDFNIIVLSNLSLCGEETIKLLQEIRPQYINVSLYSMNPAEHDAITTVKGSWERTMNAILACERSGLNVRIAAPLLRINRYAFSDLKKFATEHNMHLVPDFSIIARADHDSRNLEFACSQDELEEVLRNNKEIFDMGWAGVCRDDPDARLCDIGRFRIHLNARGDFYPCPSMYGYVLGNLKETTIMDVWHGDKLRYLRELKWRDMGKCIDCEHRQFCEPCLAYNFNATGNMFKTIPEKCRTARIVHGVYGDVPMPMCADTEI